MTTENGSFEDDALVTETYRELGVEKVPEHLNQSILKMASKDAGEKTKQNFLYTAWMKPLAWAATIGLCLAIVLQLSEVPTAITRPDMAPATEMMLEEAALQGTDLVEEPDTVQREGSKNELDRAANTPKAVEVFSRQPKGKSDAIAAPAQLSLPLEPARDEESSARKRAVQDSPADIEPMASFSALAEEKETDTAASCNETARLSRDDWLQCIDNLRLSGAEEAANTEYEAFVLRYSVESYDSEENK